MRKMALLMAVAVAAVAQAQQMVGVRLYDMFKTENVLVLTSDEFRQLKADLAEEKRVFSKALNNVKREWTKRVTEARKAGDKDFPKYPTKQFVWVRTCKTKNFTTKAAADEWYAKQKARVDGEMAVKAAAMTAAAKAAKGGMTAGYGSRDERKERQKAERKQMETAVMEKLGEEVELQMALLLKYNRPVPRHFIVDPVAGAEKNLSKQILKQEEALKAYQERKAAAEAATEPAE